MSFEKTAAPHPDETIVALSSAPGGGARAIVRVSGPRTRDVVARVFEVKNLTPRPPLRSGEGEEEGGPIRFAPRPPLSASERGPWGEVLSWRRLVPGTLHLTNVFSPVPADFYFFAGPHSYTGQDLAELHTLGSPPIVERLIADLLAAGARPARPGEFTLRAFLAGKMDLPRAEAVHAVIEAGTDSDLKQALVQLAGGVTRPLERLRDDLLNLLADVEAGLDFAHEDIEFVGQAATVDRLSMAVARLESLRCQLDDRAVSGRPLRVALVGRPNAGKSSLFNALGTGPAALVSPIPGTTRDYLTKRLDLGGVAAELVDTAGWQAANSTIEEQAQHLSREQTERADLLLWCVEVGDDFHPDDANRLVATGAEVVRVRTKEDRRQETGDGNPKADANCSVVSPGGMAELIAVLAGRAAAFARPALAPSQSRCWHHVETAIADLRQARDIVAQDEPQELLALSLRSALDQLGEMVGTVYSNDLLDRIFSRFCIGK